MGFEKSLNAACNETWLPQPHSFSPPGQRGAIRERATVSKLRNVKELRNVRFYLKHNFRSTESVQLLLWNLDAWSNLCQLFPGFLPLNLSVSCTKMKILGPRLRGIKKSLRGIKKVWGASKKKFEGHQQLLVPPRDVGALWHVSSLPWVVLVILKTIWAGTHVGHTKVGFGKKGLSCKRI